jgi:DNA-binding GntR family transcriptional regulator
MQSLSDLDPEVKPRAAMVDRVYGFLKYQILTCKMTPGQVIREKEVCDALSVSRTPFREAVNRLFSEGLVTAPHYRAYQVAPFVESDIIDLCELRTMLEAEVVALAAQRGAPADVKRLESLAELPYEPGVPGTYDSYLRANASFHSALAQCCKNARLAATYVLIMDQLQRPLYLGLDFGLDTAAATSEHRELVKAIREGDFARARKIVVDTTGYTKTIILRGLRTHGFV